MIKKHLKKLVNVVLAAVMAMGMSVTALASEPQSSPELRTAYNNIMDYAKANNIDLDMSYQDFLNDYHGQSIQAYEQSFYSILLPQQPTTRSSGSSGGGNTYYYNTGDSCPSEATYDKYNLLSVVQKGDIIYESEGGFGITGHNVFLPGFCKRVEF